MKLAPLFSVVFCLLLASCAQPNMYYWGNYSNTLYNVNKYGTDEHKQAHLKELRYIISKSRQSNKKVPPGIYLELALIEKHNGNQRRFEQYLAMESKLFPEAAQFIQMIKQREKHD